MKTSRRFLSLLLVLALCLSLAPAVLADEPAGGETAEPALLLFDFGGMEYLDDLGFTMVLPPNFEGEGHTEADLRAGDEIFGAFAYRDSDGVITPLKAENLTVPDGLTVEDGAPDFVPPLEELEKEDAQRSYYVSRIRVDADWYKTNKENATSDKLTISYTGSGGEATFDVGIWAGVGFYGATAPTLANALSSVQVTEGNRDSLKVYFIVPGAAENDVAVDNVALSTDPNDVYACLCSAYFTAPEAVGGEDGVWSIGLRPGVELPEQFSPLLTFTLDGETRSMGLPFRYSRDRLFFQRIVVDEENNYQPQDDGDGSFVYEPDGTEDGSITLLGRFFLGEPVPGGGNLVPVEALQADGVTIEQHVPSGAPHLAEITIAGTDAAKYKIGVKDGSYSTPGNDDPDEGKVIESQPIPADAYVPFYVATFPDVVFYSDPACENAVEDQDENTPATLGWELSTLYAKPEGDLPANETVELAYKSGMTPDFVTVSWDGENEVYRFDIDMNRAYPQEDLPPFFDAADLALGLRVHVALKDNGNVIDVVGNGVNRGFKLNAPKLLYRYVVCDWDEQGEPTGYRLGDWYTDPNHYERDPIDLVYNGEDSAQTVVFYLDDGTGDPTPVDPDDLFVRKGENDEAQFKVESLDLEGELKSCFVSLTNLTENASIDQTVGVKVDDQVSDARAAIHCHLPIAAFYTDKVRSVDTLAGSELTRADDLDGKLYFIMDDDGMDFTLQEPEAWVEPEEETGPIYADLERDGEDDTYAAIWKVRLHGDAPDVFHLRVKAHYWAQYPDAWEDRGEQRDMTVFYDGMVFNPWRNDGQGFYPEKDGDNLVLRFPLYTAPCDVLYGAFYHLDARKQNDDRLTLLYPKDGNDTALRILEGEDAADGFEVATVPDDELKEGEGVPTGAAFRILVPRRTLDGHMALLAGDDKTYTTQFHVDLGNGSFYVDTPTEDTFQGRVNTGELAVTPGQEFYFQLRSDLAAGVSSVSLKDPVSWASLTATETPGLYKITVTNDETALNADLVEYDSENTEEIVRLGAELRVKFQYQDPHDANNHWDGDEGVYIKPANFLHPLNDCQLNGNTVRCRIDYMDPSGDQVFLFCALYDEEGNYLDALYLPQPRGNRGGWDAQVDLPQGLDVHHVKFFLTNPTLRPHCAAQEVGQPPAGE